MRAGLLITNVNGGFVVKDTGGLELSVTVTDTGYVPGVVGVPLIAPFEVPMIKLGGSPFAVHV